MEVTDASGTGLYGGNGHLTCSSFALLMQRYQLFSRSYLTILTIVILHYVLLLLLMGIVSVSKVKETSALYPVSSYMIIYVTTVYLCHSNVI